VRSKVSRLIRGRWFHPPFSGERLSAMLCEAFSKMSAETSGPSLLPEGHPIDLFVTATDFRGHVELLRLNSPALVHETEHRQPIGFSDLIGAPGRGRLGDPLELVFAARATASFPGAFPPLQVAEIDRLAAKDGREWTSREQFLARIMPGHVRDGTIDEAALIDGSVLVNAPFGAALGALSRRPAQREVDRRFVYIDPHPDKPGDPAHDADRPIGFFGAIFGSLSTIPREQPIRDNIERIEEQSRNAEKLRQITMAMRPDIDRTVEKLFGRTFFMDSPTPKRLAAWRAKAQQAAAEQAGYAFQSYAQTKLSAIIDRLASVVHAAIPEGSRIDERLIAHRLRDEADVRGLTSLAGSGGGATSEAIAFFRTHDIGFRIRRLQLLARRLSRDWELDPEIDDDALDLARERIYAILAMYFAADDQALLGEEFRALAANVVTDPGAALDYLAKVRLLPETDIAAEELLAAALDEMPRNLKRRMLLTYLGFPFFDVATLPLLQRDGLFEYNPVKVDRISPEDALSIREGGLDATLRGTEFYNFGAFFSRAYRENDYLWGRLHGAERMVDLVTSTVEGGLPTDDVRTAKRDAFLAIIDEELAAGRCQKGLLEQLRAEVLERMV
jgi:patatin-related protein